MIVRGQTHGGIAQGVGQALLEHSHYDPETGQLLAANFMDYAMRRADTFPEIKTALSEVPSPSNRLGVRSGGEGGTTPALAAVINAIVDALAELGVSHIEMPATPSGCGAQPSSRAAAPRIEQYFRKTSRRRGYLDLSSECFASFRALTKARSTAFMRV
jgi:hypothetical protein